MPFRKIMMKKIWIGWRWGREAAEGMGLGWLPESEEEKKAVGMF